MSNPELKTIKGQNKKSYSYSLQEKLGSGSFAEVYKGVIDDTKEDIAIKVISKLGIAKYGPDIRKAIGSEVNILQKISGTIMTPYIVRIYECFETENNIYIILEYCNQGTLADILKTSKTLPEKDALIIIYQIVMALNVMATNEMAHRDIKPENIFIHNGVYKIGDFGFASQKKLFSTTLGTYPYMAPEIFQNKDYNSKVDVWAVAVMLHEMLFGELYFIGNSHMEVANNVQKKKYELRQPSHLTPETQNLLIKCLEKNPDLRLTSNEMKNHKAFDSVRGLPCFSSQHMKSNIGGSQIGMSSNEAGAIKVMIDNYIHSIAFVENLSLKIAEIPGNGKFAQFYLLDYAFKGVSDVKEYFNGGKSEIFLSLLNENQRKCFNKSKYYENSKSDIELVYNKLQKHYLEVINGLSYMINKRWPKEKNMILMVINNGLELDLQKLFEEELLIVKKIIIKEADDCLKRNQKDKAKECFLIAYELNIALDIQKNIKENFDFEQYEKNLNYEDILKKI